MAMPVITAKTRFILLFSFIFDGVLLDQLSKYFAAQSLAKPIIVLENIFSLRLEHNTGIAFSINIPYPLLIFLNILFFGGIIFYLLRNLDMLKLPSLLIIAFLASGALGNLIDRLRLGYVIDFISVGSWPVFNLADTFICIAIFLLIVFYDKIKRPN